MIRLWSPFSREKLKQLIACKPLLLLKLDSRPHSACDSSLNFHVNLNFFLLFQTALVSFLGHTLIVQYSNLVLEIFKILLIAADVAAVGT